LEVFAAIDWTAVQTSHQNFKFAMEPPNFPFRLLNFGPSCNGLDHSYLIAPCSLYS